MITVNIFTDFSDLSVEQLSSAEEAYANLFYKNLLNSSIISNSLHKKIDQEVSQSKNTVTLGNFASKVVLGSPPYSLKEGLLSSKSTKISAKGARYLTVPLNKGSDFRRLNEKSQGWIHPGFNSKIEELLNSISDIRAATFILQK